jgi:hypothetical protein
MINKEKKIRIFHSFEEENEFTAMENAAVSGIDHLRYTIGLIKRIYNYDSTGKPEKKFKIVIR